MSAPPLRTAAALAVPAVLCLALAGCSTEKAVEKSFTDKHGRACTYVMVEGRNGDKDVANLSCEYPPTPAPSSPSPSPS
ncbi:hypothetical protein [Spirillospora sp. NPDC029432]|uniref:hypothetical protein n=1 Tax=Spirillospora sp. NPDC029432 TaxID=3154599 RepID=UPI003452CB69